MNIVLIFLITIFSVSLFFYGKSKTKTISIKDNIKLNALPKFYGYYLVLWCSIPALVFLLVWSLFEPVIIKSIIIETAANQGAIFSDKNEANLIYEKKYIVKSLLPKTQKSQEFLEFFLFQTL